MTTAPRAHAWVAARRDTITFALQVDTRSDDPAPGRSVLAAGRLAEELGFDAFFTGDHPSWQSEVWLHMAALAGTTERIGLGPMVTSVLYRPPVLTARLAADLDHLSNGRLVLGLGIGWDAAALGWGTNEFDRMGLPYPPTRERQEALAEAIAIIRGVWGPEPFSFQGRHFTAKDAQVVPPPLQGMPPFVIAGAGERTLRQVAELADACNIGPVVTGGVDTLEQARGKLEVLRHHCDTVGRPYENILRSHFTIWLILAEDEASVRRKVDRYFPDGLDSIWQRCVVAGTPEQVIPYYQSYADAGMQYFIAQVLDARDEETFRLLAQEVMPRIRPDPAVDGGNR
jgi:alkanesulfonate monooxygenase SsuD/methylene tetrahydromethanopterin reductase-like flavin-dependent oxidoreductase (luciferase family)